MMKIQFVLVVLFAGALCAQERSISGGGARRNRFSAGKAHATGFSCPEDFGYYPHPTDCAQYFVCVFGGALLESCNGGLVYSTELQTCDWPRNVVCNPSGGSISTVKITDPRTQARGTNRINSVTESILTRGVDNSIRGGRQTQKSSGNSKSIFEDSASRRQGRFLVDDHPQRIDTGFQAQESSSRAFNVVPSSQSAKTRNSFTLDNDSHPKSRRRRDVSFPIPTNTNRQPRYHFDDYKRDYTFSISDAKLPRQGDRSIRHPPFSLDPYESFSQPTYTDRYNPHYSEYSEDRRPSPVFSTDDDLGFPFTDDYPQRDQYHNQPDHGQHSSSYPTQARDSYYSNSEYEYESPNVRPDRRHRPKNKVTFFSVEPQPKRRPKPQSIPYPSHTKDSSSNDFNYFNIGLEHSISQDFRNTFSSEPNSYVEENERENYDRDQYYFSGFHGRPHENRDSKPKVSFFNNESKEPSDYYEKPIPKPKFEPPLIQGSVYLDPPVDEYEEYHLSNNQFVEPDTYQENYTPKPKKESKLKTKNRVPSFLKKNERKNITPVPTRKSVEKIKSYKRPQILSNPVKTKRPSNFKRPLNLTRSVISKRPVKPKVTSTTPKTSPGSTPLKTSVVVKTLSKTKPLTDDTKELPVKSVMPKFKPRRKNKLSSVRRPPQIPGTIRHRELSKIPSKPRQSTTDDSSNTGSSSNKRFVPARATTPVPKVDKNFYNDLLNLNDTEYYYYYYDDILDYDYAEPTVQTAAPVAKKPSRSSSRGSSRNKSKTSSKSSSGGVPQLQGRSPSRLIRPSKKQKPSREPIVNIWKHPPRRPNPLYPQPEADVPATECDRNTCRLPDCSCGGPPIPGDIPVDSVPQIVMLTFDDSVNDLNKGLYKDLFERGRVNANGCPISATFYVSHEWTNYQQVQNLYADGHEIASHSVSHSFGEQFSTEKWAKEIGGQREIMSAYGGVRMEDIRGMRAPFLAVGGNNMFRMLYDLNFTYDSSMPVYKNNPPSWPYTLDYKLFHECMIPPCPTNSYPGLWEMPMVMWVDLLGGRCSMGDACTTPPDAEGVYKMLIQNFERHYTTNRAPMGLYYHAAWFTTPHHKEGFIAFLDTIAAMDDVWLVSTWQALQWTRDATPLTQIKSFPPFQCDYPERPPRCTSPRVCNVWHKGSVRYMKSCHPCPERYPWTGSTGVPSPLNNL